MGEVVLQEVETYDSCRQNTVANSIATRPIMELYLVTERKTGLRVSKRWWDQDGVDMEGMRMAAQEAEGTEGEEETDQNETATD